MRSQYEVCTEIANSTDEERGVLIRRVRDADWTDERKAEVMKFIMLLGLVGRNCKPQ